MSIFKQRVIDYMEKEWGTYVARFNGLPEKEGLKRVNAMGYPSFRDLLAHILEWWEEGMTIVLAIAEEREYERKKYDFDEFNAGAVAKYKNWEGERFMAHFEEVRLKTAAGLRSMNDAVFGNPRLQAWLHGVIIHHAREHMLVPSRFLVEDTMEHEWAGYISGFTSMPPEKQAGWMKRQGFARFEDIAAHIIGWWEEGVRVIEGVLQNPSFEARELDVDQFNAELVEKYSLWKTDDLFAEFEKVRKGSLEFIRKLSDADYRHPVIADWLAADFIAHIDEH